MMQEMWNAPPGFRPSKSAPCSPAKPLGVSRTRSESFHITHKVPVGDTPYVRAKNVQVMILSFWVSLFCFCFLQGFLFFRFCYFNVLSKWVVLILCSVGG
jgi:hypothetical protein